MIAGFYVEDTHRLKEVFYKRKSASCTLENTGDILNSMERLATIAFSNHSLETTEESHEKSRMADSLKHIAPEFK
jgi:hypothetical protein